MFRFFIYCGTLVLFMTLPGCSSVKAEKNTPDFPQSQMSSLDPMRTAMLQKRAEAFTQAMVRSFKSNDFSHWKAFLEKESTPGRPLIVQEKSFKEMKQRFEKNWGTLVNCHYLGSLDQSIIRDYIWKCTFESMSGNGKVIRLEELFVIRCTLLNGKTAFTGFGFRFFNRPGFRDQVKKNQKAEVKNEKINRKAAEDSGLHRRIHPGAGNSSDGT